MKKIIWIYLLFFGLISCKKEPVTADRSTHDSLLADSATISSPDHPQAFTVGTLDDQPAPGKTVFTENGKTFLTFDTNANTGIILINSKKVQLTAIDFVENQYKISGKDIRITAENGDFEETSGNCTTGNFPEINITYRGEAIMLKNIRVQDCPTY